MKITHGNWISVFSKVDDCSFIYSDTGKNNEIHIATVYGVNKNAQLISASPDLLEACNEWIENFDDGHLQEFPGWEPYINKIKKAIAKAEGKK